MTEQGRAFLFEATPSEIRVLRELCFSFEQHRQIGARLGITWRAVQQAQYRLGVKMELTGDCGVNRGMGRRNLRHHLLLWTLIHGVLPLADLEKVQQQSTIRRN